MDKLLLATAHGLVVCERAGADWRECARGLTTHKLTSLIAREGVILAGTTSGVFRSDDVGQTWQVASAGLTSLHIRWLAYHPAISDREFAGTEPAGIFVSHDGATTWRECAEVAELRIAHDWYLPYSPEAGCVRGFAFHGARGYAAVEVGGVLRSDDGGERWRMAEDGDGETARVRSQPVHPDVHMIAVHPAAPDLVFAPTGGGLYRSEDGGRSWAAIYAGCYCRAIWLDPTDPDHLIFGPAAAVGRGGRIEETRDGGRTWAMASIGLDTPWQRHMVERFAQIGDELLAVLSNGELIAAPLASLEWRPCMPAQTAVAAATTMAE
jgi:photosystem II stability/assembly factor-like uncharacterized protein